MKRLLLPLALCMLLAACSSRAPAPYDVEHAVAHAAAGSERGRTPARSPVAEASGAALTDANQDGVAPTQDSRPLPEENTLILHFASGRSDPDAGSQAELDALGAILAANPALGVLVEGHTDDAGQVAANLELSYKRAAGVAQYLMQAYGLALERFRVRGRGEAEPAADNATPQGRLLNRRVVLTVGDMALPVPQAGDDLATRLPEDRESPPPSGEALAPQPDLAPGVGDDAPGSSPVAGQDRRTQVRAGLAALGQEDYARAFAVFSALLRQFPEDEDINFNMGLSARGMGNHPLALFYFERLLAWRPEADRVRLEAAVTYLAMEQPEEARQEFEIVLSHNPPEEVRRNIMALLEPQNQAPERTQVNGALQLGVFHDNNANTGPASDRMDTMIGTVILDDAALPVDDTGFMASANLNVARRLDDAGHWYAVVGGAHYRTEYHDENDFDTATTQGRAGVRYAAGNHAVQVQGKLQDVDFGGHDLMDISGGNLTYLYALTPKTHLIADVQGEWRDNLVNDERDSLYATAGAYTRFLMGDRGGSLIVGGRVFRDDADEAKYTSHGWELSAQYTMVLPHEITMNVALSYRETAYDGPPSTLVTENREDRQKRFGYTVQKGLWEGLSVVAGLELMENSSGFDAFSYEKAVCSLGLLYEF